jgi:glycerol kinase
LQSLHADGGPTRNQFLMQFTADLTGVDLKAAEVSEASAWGAALNGLLGLAVFRSLDELVHAPRELKNYSPAMDRASAEHLYDGWRNAVKRIL